FGAGRLGIDVEYDMRNDIYDHLHRLDFARHDELQSGQLVSRANSDVRIVQTLLGFLPFMSGSVLLFFLWYTIGAIVLYFVYGMRNSRLAKGLDEEPGPDMGEYVAPVGEQP
ncbi:hypothetical protein GWI34_44965, partial [Actinomadura sp. DSM 109109]|nr:hypothetical protein [Actinomadura lepetitiana]